VYDQDAALATASAAASVATTAAAANKRNLDERWINAQPKPTSTAAATPTPTTAPPDVTSVPVPSTCAPVSWTNTFAFTSDTACPTPFEVGTYCGFINPKDPCAPQPAGYGPPTTPDTVEAFQNNPVYHQEAQNAKTPSRYTRTFVDLNATVNVNSYLGFKQLSSYDIEGYASFCGATSLCTGFNVYSAIQRGTRINALAPTQLPWPTTNAASRDPALRKKPPPTLTSPATTSKS
jgi:hypothetical protein